jgi:deoxyribodipyrimidine photo-lyase
MALPRVPPIRVRAANGQSVRRDRAWVLYWMVASRRPTFNFGLQRAAGHALALGKPLVVLEALRAGYPFASDRLHRFVLEGMAHNRAHFAVRPVLYHPYVEPTLGAGKGLLEALAAQACVVVTDEYPAFFLPRMLASAARRLDVRLEAVDGNGLLPLRAAERPLERAVDFRRLLQRALPPHLHEPPADDTLRRLSLPALDALPTSLHKRWPAADDTLLSDPSALARLQIDHSVPPVPYAGGTRAAVAQLRRFLSDGLDRYLDRHHPDAHAESGLSPYLHFGHMSAHQVFAELAARQSWSPDALPAKGRGQREGWWGMSPAAEAFLDQLVTWRELGYHHCHHHRDYDTWDSLPAWARQTLTAHRSDPRPALYTQDQLERAETDDSLWNAAQRQLLAEGRIHNYLRMLWGKRVLEWCADPRDALRTLLYLNDRHAVDGRDPNSYSGITWVFGRHDRPWPERPIFGTVRSMTSRSTLKKLRLREYLSRWGA